MQPPRDHFAHREKERGLVVRNLGEVKRVLAP
jgi:hypothetical protein